jgi:uncharacterized protein
MGEKRLGIKIGEWSPSAQFVAALVCVPGVFLLAYPLFLLAGLVAGIDLDAFHNAISGQEAAPGSLKYLQFAQHCSLFILPVFVWSLLFEGRILAYTGLNHLPRPEHVMLAIIIALVIIPVNSYATHLNAGLSLPEWLSGAESWIDARDNQAELLTSLMIRSGSLDVLLVNLFVLALIPAIGEELFFRGLLINLLRNMVKNHHLIIIMTAVVFSALHFQFSGLIPRILLGVVYGYLYIWSKSVWLPAIAHFINNAIPVFLSRFHEWETVSGTATDLAADKPIFPAVSVLALAVLLIYARRVLNS